ncbi:MAG: tetratricopeptide repeat protein, partial [Saprospiraceae bacterium]
TSPYFKEADAVINELLENTSDYAAAIQIIEGMPSPSEKIKLTYQNICLKFGMQQYNNGQKEEAITHLTKALKYNLSNLVSAQAKFWTGQIQNDQGEYQKSIQTMQEYFDISNGLTGLPDESSTPSGHYLQGYNYLMLKDHGNSEKSFKNAIVGFSLQKDKIKNMELLNEIWPDALARVGDCLFRVNKYKEAGTYYDQVIAKKQGSYVYAIFQKGMIEGLLGEPYEKILTLKDLKTKYPNSEYADNALMQLGDTYFDLDNVDNAYNAYNELVIKYKNSPLKNSAYLKLGLIAYNKGDLNAAIIHYKSIFQNNPTARESESAMLGLQEIYINDLGKSEEYVAFVGTIPGYKISESTADSLAFAVGAMRYNIGEYEKAVSGFNNYLDKYPNGGYKVKAVYYRAESHTLLKNYTAGLEDYERLAKLGSSEFYIQSVKKAALISYNYTQDFAKSYQYYHLYYNSITDENEKYIAAIGALRSAFRTSNAEAVKLYAPIVLNNKLAPDDEKATASYYLAKIYLRENDLENAKTSFVKASNNVNTNQAAESRYMIAEILYKQNQSEKAEQQCNEANEKNTAYPYWIAKSLLLMSDIYVDKKDLFNARAAIEAVIENFPTDQDLIGIAKDKLKVVEELEKQKSRIKPTSKNLLELQSNGGK